MTEKECFFIKGRECEKGDDKCVHIWHTQCSKEKEEEE